MTWQMIAGLAALVVSILLLRRLGRGGKHSRHPYQKQAGLFSADDRAFFRPLKAAMGGEYEVFGKIRVEDIIIPRQGAEAEADSPLAGRHFDFVLCDPASLAVACVIQLHDKTRDGRQAESDPLPAICESLGLPWARFPVKADYSVDEIQDKLSQAMAKEAFYFVDTDGRKEPRISNLDGMKF